MVSNEDLESEGQDDPLSGSAGEATAQPWLLNTTRNQALPNNSTEMDPWRRATAPQRHLVSVISWPNADVSSKLMAAKRKDSYAKKLNVLGLG